MLHDGGSAFPMMARPIDGDLQGLSKRDYFAALALAGMLGNAALVEIEALGAPDASPAAADAAAVAYRLADAMLRERLVERVR